MALVHVSAGKNDGNALALHRVFFLHQGRQCDGSCAFGKIMGVLPIGTNGLCNLIIGYANKAVRTFTKIVEGGLNRGADGHTIGKGMGRRARNQTSCFKGQFGRIDMRLAERLLALARDSDEVHATHQELARELGTAREVISRQLTEFHRRGWIDQARGRVSLADRPALEIIAQG